MKLGVMTDYLESIAPLRFQESYDNSGLLYGDRNWELKGSLICLDATSEVINEAIELGCNLVVAHHPIIFSGIKKFNPDYYVDEAVITAIKNDVALYAIHTNLDNVLNSGVNEKIAKRLHLTHLDTLRSHSLDPMESDYTVGSGIIGSLSSAREEKDFLSFVKQTMNCQVIKHTQLLGKPVKTVAVCGGSGSFLLKDAIDAKADVFITADCKYHQFFDANGKIVIVDTGHYESEQFTIELIYELIKKKFAKFAAHCTKLTTNPVQYF